MIIFENCLPLVAKWLSTGEKIKCGEGTIILGNFGYVANIPSIKASILISSEVYISSNKFSSCEVSKLQKYGLAWDENHHKVWKPTNDNECIWRVTKLNL